MNFRIEKLEQGHTRDLTTFDCGATVYNTWLSEHALSSVRAGVCAVYLLIESSGGSERVAGYFAISPTLVLRDQTPHQLSRGWPLAVPAWRLGKLAFTSTFVATPQPSGVASFSGKRS